MYVVVRSYSGAGVPELFELLGQREEEVKSLIGGVPGFVSYVIFSSRDSGMTVTICQDKVGTDESSRRAAAWVKENVSVPVTHPRSRSEVRSFTSEPAGHRRASPTAGSRLAVDHQPKFNWRRVGREGSGSAR
jgi:hypothetical protein